MSPVSRRRKGAKSRKQSGGARVLRSVPTFEPGPCDCPACTGEEVDIDAMLADLRKTAGELLTVDDPIEPELLAAMFLSAGNAAGEGFEEAFAEDIVPVLAAAADAGALSLLLALDTVRSSPAGARAARRLIAAGVPEPAWAAAAREPLTGGMFLAHRFEAGVASVLACSFERAGRVHGFVLRVDHTDCHAAIDVVLLPGEALDEFVAQIPDKAKGDGIKVVTEELTPEDFRWEIERALDARAVHDDEDGEPPAGAIDDDEGPDYGTLAELLRARMRVLPEPSRPPASHGDGSFSLADEIRAIAETAQRVERRAGRPKLPPKRKKSDGAAPIYGIKVGLRGAKPPIWRRIELPADTTLARLHRIIQVAFGWDDSHLHVFETSYGEFGVADRELGHRAEGPVTLEQVAPAEGDRLSYLYDFGDSWLHEIEVEAVLDPDAAVKYPRCTGGRRAAPAEDCGGIWGYEELVAILADPSHPEHEERLEWLGLDSAADFQPARFDAAEVTRALGAIAKS